MKKNLKITIIIVVILIGIVLIDSVQALIFNNSPIIKIRTDASNGFYVDKGILVNHYNCSENNKKSVLKTTKYACQTSPDEIKEFVFNIQTKETNKCNDEKKLYYTLKDNRKIYTYCLDAIYIYDYENAPVDLKEYLNDNDDTKIMQEIINTLELTTTANDGGSSVYKDNGNSGFTNNGLTIISCKTKDGNNDIFIGPKNMDNDVNVCQTK